MNDGRVGEQYDLLIHGIPDHVPEHVAALCRSRLLKAVGDLLHNSQLKEVEVTVGTPSRMQGYALGNHQEGKTEAEELTVAQRARQYRAERPLYDFDFLIVPDHVKEDILSAVSLISLEKKVFDEWNLRVIEPFPRTALNFHGPTGTGKTLAAHAIAQNLRLPILVASYAQIESKYHGDGPKNVEALFHAAQRDGAVLFIDEADSLLSKRLPNASQGSEQAINSMRSQLLICLGRFQGVVIFATNFVESYDKAFRSRVRDVYFPLPDEECRGKIWRQHFPERFPLAGDVSVEALSKLDGLSGRDIKHAVIDAALRAARAGKDEVDLMTLINAVERIKASQGDESSAAEEKLGEAEEAEITAKVKMAIVEDHP